MFALTIFAIGFWDAVKYVFNKSISFFAFGEQLKHFCPDVWLFKINVFASIVENTKKLHLQYP